MSKGTTDSGVVMDKDIPMLPGAVPRKLPPLTSEWIRETHPEFLRQEATAQDRQKSSEILEELLNQGIISVEQTKGRSRSAGEAFSIMLNDRGVVRQQPPARLESLKAKKAQTLPSREDIEEKIRLADERRKLREDELKMRLRAKSAHVHVRTPILRTDEDKDTSPTHVEPLESSLGPDLLHPPVAEAEEFTEETGGDGTECTNEMSRAEESEDGDEEEDARDLLTALRELESDSSFQHVVEKEQTF
ncbi:Stathmin domain-containing protein 1 [Channa argus]|uniref:Stathmin domain-containing protein 1 n=2 Tax=Channa argus TaxID=215402 RepID=A0A6G1QXM9_CHAAH|nr:Stathmin domain-containing protein 1 [Channa argus]